MYPVEKANDSETTNEIHVILFYILFSFSCFLLKNVCSLQFDYFKKYNVLIKQKAHIHIYTRRKNKQVLTKWLEYVNRERKKSYG